MAPKTVDLIFTRDYSLPMSDLWQRLLSDQVKQEFGAGLDHQICRFIIRSAEYYRLRDELSTIKEAVKQKGPGTPLFSEACTEVFRSAVDTTRKILKEVLEPQKRRAHFARVVSIFSELYPQYMLAVFLPNPWKQYFLDAYPKEGPEIIERIYQNRVYSEGLFWEVDVYCRTVAGQLLVEQGQDPKLAQFFRFDELEQSIRGGDVPPREALEQRSEGYILYGQKLLVTKNFDNFLSENELQYTPPSFNTTIQEFRGQTACSGAPVRGMVRIVMNAADVAIFPVGSILVTTMTEPDFVPAMKKALAIVTEEGGITCHAAIVSREMGIPCVIGTKIATKVLKDGDMVEVDAEKGIVRKI